MLLSKSMFDFLLLQALLWQAVESLGIWHPLWRQEVCVLARNYRLVSKSSSIVTRVQIVDLHFP